MRLPIASCIHRSELVAAKDPSRKQRMSKRPSSAKSTLSGQVGGVSGAAGAADAGGVSTLGAGAGGVAVMSVLGAAAAGLWVMFVLAVSGGVGSVVMMKDRSEE